MGNWGVEKTCSIASTCGLNSSMTSRKPRPSSRTRSASDNPCVDWITPPSRSTGARFVRSRIAYPVRFKPGSTPRTHCAWAAGSKRYWDWLFNSFAGVIENPFPCRIPSGHSPSRDLVSSPPGRLRSVVPVIRYCAKRGLPVPRAADRSEPILESDFRRFSQKGAKLRGGQENGAAIRLCGDRKVTGTLAKSGENSLYRQSFEINLSCRCRICRRSVSC